jgi:lysine-N-methylase
LPEPAKRLQPHSYHSFRCIGADCEDTCCTGWNVNVDKLTYEAYQRCDDPELGPRLHQLVTIGAASASDDTHARITLSGVSCPFLAEGLCAIQKKLGEQYLSTTCAKYPRVLNVVDNVLQRSLDLSCPEAARIVLLDPNPMEFDEEEGPPHDPRLGRLSVLTTGNRNPVGSYRYFHEIRASVIWLLQYRDWPLWKRLVILGLLCDQLHDMAAAGRHARIPGVLQWYRDAAAGELLDQGLNDYRAQASAQLEMVLEMIVGRIGSDFTSERFFACYQEFMQGVQWTAEASMEDIAHRYASAFAQHYAPFLSRHQYMLEHYLVSYVHRTLFPLGPQEGNRESGVHDVVYSIREQYLLMMVHYAIVQTLLIGLAGFHQADFATAHVIKVIQSCTKAFGHSLSFPARSLRILADRGLKTCAGMAMLLRN